MNNAKWTWFAIGYQCIFAYGVALCVYQFGTFFAGGEFKAATAAAAAVLAGFLYLLFRRHREASGMDLSGVVVGGAKV